MTKPAKGIMLTRDFGDSKWFRVACDCGSTEHDIDFVVEVDDEMKQIVVHTYTTQHTNYWYESIASNDWWDKVPDSLHGIVYNITGMFNSIYRKVALTWTLWTKGTIEYQSTTIMQKDVAKNYANTILENIAELERKL